MKTLLAIWGGAHENGSTQAMLACARDAARRAGWQVRDIRLKDLRVAHCTGCRACEKTKRCVVEDDVQEVARLLEACDVVALAAPTYWANVPGLVKDLFDRLFGTVIEETATFPRPLLRHRPRYLLLTACNTAAPFSWMFGQSRGALRAMDEFFKTAGMKRLGAVTFAGARGSGTLPAAVEKRIRRYWR